MGELGLFGMSIPSEYGGSELDTMASVVLGEELGQSTFGGVTGSVLAHTDMAVPHLTRFGTPEQKEKFLPASSLARLLALSPSASRMRGPTSPGFARGPCATAIIMC